jgi:hypothetical protein
MEPYMQEAERASKTHQPPSEDERPLFTRSRTELGFRVIVSLNVTPMEMLLVTSVEERDQQE